MCIWSFYFNSCIIEYNFACGVTYICYSKCWKRLFLHILRVIRILGKGNLYNILLQVSAWLTFSHVLFCAHLIVLSCVSSSRQKKCISCPITESWSELRVFVITSKETSPPHCVLDTTTPPTHPPRGKKRSLLCLRPPLHTPTATPIHSFPSPWV